MSNESIKVVLNYKNESYTIEVQKYKQLKVIKERAYKLFYPIKTDIDIKYNNKSLSSLLNQSIGMIFNDKSFVRLMIISIPGVSKSIKLKTNKNKHKILTPLNLNNNNKSIQNENITISTPKTHNKEMIINSSRKTEVNKTIEITKTEMNNNKKINKLNYYEELNLKKNGKKKLPPIKLENDNNNNLNKNDYDIIAFNNCSECITSITSEYCRKCNKFLCLNCANKNHSNDDHKLFEIDENEKINISRYKEELNKYFYSSLNYFNTNLDVEDVNMDVDKAKNNFEKLINMLTEVAQGIKDNICDNDNNELNNDNNKKIIEDKINNIKEEMNSKDYEKDNENNINVFKELYLKDKNINRLIKEYKCSNNEEYANNKIQKLFGDVEDEIDIIMFELEENINAEKISGK